MKDFKNIKNIGRLCNLPFTFVFEPVDGLTTNTRPGFLAENNAGKTEMYVRLSEALTKAYNAGKITIAEMRECMVINLDSTKKYPEYVLRIPLHLLDGWVSISAEEIEEMQENLSLISIDKILKKLQCVVITLFV